MKKDIWDEYDYDSSEVKIFQDGEELVADEHKFLEDEKLEQQYAHMANDVARRR